MLIIICFCGALNYCQTSPVLATLKSEKEKICLCNAVIEVKTVVGMVFILAFELESENIYYFLKCFTVDTIFQEDMSSS